MARGTLATAALGALLALTPASARGQSTAQFWYSAEVGAASTRFTCDPCAPTRDSGPALTFAAGALARPGVRVGVEWGYWTHQEEELRESVKHAGLLARLDIRPGSGLHLIGGLGWVGWRSEPFSYDALDVSAGAGWDVPLAGRWALSNSVVLHAASFGHLRNGDEPAVRDVSLSLTGFQVGLIRR